MWGSKSSGSDNPLLSDLFASSPSSSTFTTRPASSSSSASSTQLSSDDPVIAFLHRNMGFSTEHITHALSAVGSKDQDTLVNWMLDNPSMEEHRFASTSSTPSSTSVDVSAFFRPSPDPLERLRSSQPRPPPSSSPPTSTSSSSSTSSTSSSTSIPPSNPNPSSNPNSSSNPISFQSTLSESDDVLPSSLPFPRPAPYAQRLPHFSPYLHLLRDSEGASLYFDYEAVHSDALHGRLKERRVRGLAYRVFWGVVSRDAGRWAAEVEGRRREYGRMEERYFADPRREEDAAHPLEGGGEWERFFMDSELKRVIEMDVERIFPEHAFFALPRTREILTRVLFVFATENPEIGYRQGMHELVAPLYYVLECDALDDASLDDASLEDAALEDATPDANAPDTDAPAAPPPDEGELATKREDDRLLAECLFAVHDRRFVEHDTFALFSALMTVMLPLYDSGAPNARGANPIVANPHPSLGVAATPSNPALPANPIVKRCHFIQNDLLRRIDPQLYHFMKDLSVEPQIYGLRWIRLLLGREFHLLDVLVVWDALFAHGSSLALLDYVIVAMLVYVRESLFARDATGVLQRLLRYPPVEDVHCFVAKALGMLKTSHAEWEGHFVRANPLAPANVATISATISHPLAPAAAKERGNKEKSKARNLFGNLFSSEGEHHFAEVDAASSQARIMEAQNRQIMALEQRVRAMEVREARLGEMLGEVVSTLHKEMIDTPGAEGVAQLPDAVVVAIAELKHIKDIMAGLVEPPWQQSPENS